MTFLFCALLTAPGRAEQPPVAPDFRNIVWGMSQREVMATETAKPVEIRQAGDETVVKYDSPAVGETSRRLIYIFAGDKLVRAKYIFDREHDNLNDFIADFRNAEPALRETYGKPTSERAVWEDDSLQQERLPYLEQDRALASDILPSDQNAGLAVLLGHLRLYSRWVTPRTKVVHALSGENNQITHQIEYRSSELEAFENDMLHQKTPGLQ